MESRKVLAKGLFSPLKQLTSTIRESLPGEDNPPKKTPPASSSPSGFLGPKADKVLGEFVQEATDPLRVFRIFRSTESPRENSPSKESPTASSSPSGALGPKADELAGKFVQDATDPLIVFKSIFWSLEQLVAPLTGVTAEKTPSNPNTQKPPPAP